MMKKYLLFLGLSLALTQSARASYVQGGTTTGGTGTSIVCTINSGSGSVTSGHMEVMAILNNGFATTGISSTRVPSWTRIAPTGSNVELWYGVSTSSGAETITVTLNGSTQFAGVCGEYTETAHDQSANSGASTNTVSVTTTHAVETLVTAAAANTTLTLTNFTLRQTSILPTGPNQSLLLGDLGETSTGTYSSNTNINSHQTLVSFYGSVSVMVPRHR
jgi:hypothetical protein